MAADNEPIRLTLTMSPALNGRDTGHLVFYEAVLTFGISKRRSFKFICAICRSVN
jgi:hypothetical protein